MNDEIQQGLSFAAAADAYDRARPSYPVEAAQWLIGSGRSTVLELGAGTGKLTNILVDQGHQVIATDPAPHLLRLLHKLAPGATAVVASAERIPLPDRSVDVVVCAQSFHLFKHASALPEIARVLRPGGVLALIWNVHDQSIPWVRKLDALLGDEDGDVQTQALLGSEHFGWIDEKQFRNWSKHTHETLADLVKSQSAFAMLYEERQTALLKAVDDLYADYGRGHDGMLLPFRTSCFRAAVQHVEPVISETPERAPVRPPPEDPDSLLIDFK